MSKIREEIWQWRSGISSLKLTNIEALGEADGLNADDSIRLKLWENIQRNSRPLLEPEASKKSETIKDTAKNAKDHSVETPRSE